jgi:hypothetical protein
MTGVRFANLEVPAQHFPKDEKNNNFGQRNQSSSLNLNSAPKNKCETILNMIVKMMSGCGHVIPGSG